MDIEIISVEIKKGIVMITGIDVSDENLRRIQYQYIGNPEGEYVKLSNGEFVKSNSRNYLNRYGVPLLRYDRVPIYENGKILRKKEYVGRFKLSNLNAAKKYIADQISVDKENNILINKIIRDQIVKSKKQINIFEDHDMAKQFR